MSEPLSVKCQFFGICTHFRPESMPNAVDWLHRVVLVNASDPEAFRSEQPRLADVGPHVARLQILAADLIGPPPATPWFPITFYDGLTVEWKLDGVTLSIGQAIPTVGTPSGVQSCIPSLSAYCGSPQISPAGPRSYEADKSKTACFFDFGSVNVEGRGIQGGAAVAVIPVFSDNPTMMVKRFDGETISFSIRAGSHISVSNLPEDKSVDKDQDFLLHFLTVHPFPLEAGYPTDSLGCLEMLETYNVPRHLGDGTVPGCSDSNYP
jgi:hypothetical protein